MNSEKSAKSQKSVATYVRGIFNSSKSCYAIAIAQILLHTPGVLELLLPEEHEAICRVENCARCKFSELAKMYAGNGTNPIKIDRFMNTVYWDTDKFMPNCVGESYDFFRYAMDKFDDVSKVFQFEIGIGTACPWCGHSQYKPEGHNCLVVPKNERNSLLNGLKCFFLDETTLAECEDCGRKSESHTQYRITSFPDCMAIAMEHYELKPKQLKYEEEIDFKPYAADGESHIYTLYAVLIRAKAGLEGHCFAFVKDHTWRVFDDQKFNIIGPDKALNSKDGLMFFYQSCNFASGTAYQEEKTADSPNLGTNKERIVRNICKILNRDQVIDANPEAEPENANPEAQVEDEKVFPQTENAEDKDKSLSNAQYAVPNGKTTALKEKLLANLKDNTSSSKKTATAKKGKVPESKPKQPEASNPKQKGKTAKCTAYQMQNCKKPQSQASERSNNSGVSKAIQEDAQPPRKRRPEGQKPQPSANAPKPPGKEENKKKIVKRRWPCQAPDCDEISRFPVCHIHEHLKYGSKAAAITGVDYRDLVDVVVDLAGVLDQFMDMNNAEIVALARTTAQRYQGNMAVYAARMKLKGLYEPAIPKPS
jgi:hypothetical protein